MSRRIPLQAILMSLAVFIAARGSSAQVTTNPSPVPARETNFNFGWLFSKVDPAGATMPEFQDANWRHVDLPHDWSIEGPFSTEWASGTGFSPGGLAWYRKHFKLDAANKAKRVAIEFDGAYANAEVYLNGFLVGGRPYGFSSFECDLTPYLKFGGADNVIAVRIDHSRFADSRFYTGSGIDRNVRLRMTDNIHVASHGVYVTTPQVSNESANVHVETTIEVGNGSKADSAQPVAVQTDILDADGKSVPGATASMETQVDASQTLNLELKVDHPHRWSLQAPTLYTLRTRVMDGQHNVVDETTTPFGIRTIHFDANTGFFLNDMSIKLKGVCIHHDAGCVGAAVPLKMIARRLQVLKDVGVNAIRTSHNPPDPQLLDLCDQMGLVVMDESFDEFMPAKNKWVEGVNVGVPSRSGYAELFEKWSATDVADMVKRDRNHPSIIMWSIGNEVDYANDPFSAPVLGDEYYKPQNPPATELTRLGKPLVETVKKFDHTRPVTAAMANVPVSESAKFPEILDVDGYNYQEARYAADHAKFPQRIIYGSENSHRYSDWLAVRDNAFISGQFLWTGIDYLGESRGWPSRASSAGLLDTSGVKKPNGWYRQSLWSDKPMVYLCSSAPGLAFTRAPTSTVGGQGPTVPHPTTQPVIAALRGEETWNRAEGSSALVTCFSNCDEVQLTLNDKPIGSKKAADSVDGAFSWTLPFEPGSLKAVGLKNGAPACEFELKTAGPAARIVLTTEDKSLKADAIDVCHVGVMIVDAQGIRVPDSKIPVTFKINGPAKLLGIDNGEAVGAVDYAAAEHATFHGRALGIIQSTTESGTIEMEVSGPGLETARLSVSSR